MSAQDLLATEIYEAIVNGVFYDADGLHDVTAAVNAILEMLLTDEGWLLLEAAFAAQPKDAPEDGGFTVSVDQ